MPPKSTCSSRQLPWIKHTTGKTVLIKYGGSAMENPELMAQVMTDIVLLKIIGMKPIIVHGGGKDISCRIREKQHARRIQERPTRDAR